MKSVPSFSSIEVAYPSQIGKDNLVERQTFFSEFHLPKRGSIYGFGNRLSLSLFLSLSLSHLEGANVSFAPLWIRL